jgi:catechol 2,3-dioxygenase-like lactoylglutathione lyase family enzyme
MQNMKYMGVLIVVEDIARSRHFYEHVLEQRVQIDFGPNVSFEGGFAIHLKSHYQGLLGSADTYPIGSRSHAMELYFETEKLEAISTTLKQIQTEFLHDVCEQPWGQQVLRMYDPDGHIVEIAETMEAVVWRFHSQGQTPEQICARTGMPEAFVEQAIQQKNAAQ